MAEGSTSETTELPQVKPPKSDNLLSKFEGPNSGVVERVEQLEIDSLVQKIGDFYGVPEAARDKARQSTMLIVENNTLAASETDRIRKKIGEDIKPLDESVLSNVIAELQETTIEEINTKRQNQSFELQKLIEQKASSEGGVTIPLDENRSIILIKEQTKMERKMIKVHEIIHSMVQRGSEQESGFRFGREGRNFDEAAVQVLTLGFLNPDMDPEMLLKKIGNGEVVTAYPTQVQTLLTALTATALGKEAMSIKDLGGYYFKGQAEDGIEFRIGLIRRIPQQFEDVRQEVGNLLEKELVDKA